LRRREFRLARIAVVAGITLAIAAAIAANRDDVVQAQRLEPALVTICVDGTLRYERTTEATVSSILKRSGIELGPQDVVSPATDQPPYYGMVISVTRVRIETEEQTVPVPYGIRKRFTNSLPPGHVKDVSAGINGEELRRYSVRYENNVEVDRKLIDAKAVKEPVDRVVNIGSRGSYTSRGEFRSREVRIMHASAYEPGPTSCGPRCTGRTASGLRAGYGIAAVDPKVIRLGTRLYIEGYGYAIAADTGRAIKGNRIDICFKTVREARQFGLKKVKVHILEP